jgi:hypothetical protein
MAATNRGVSVSAGVTRADELVGVLARVSGGLPPERTVIAVLRRLTSTAFDRVLLAVGAGATLPGAGGAQCKPDVGPSTTSRRERRSGGGPHEVPGRIVHDAAGRRR